MRDDAVEAFRLLNEVVERLRAPGGCPWDAAQTHRSLRPYLLEETYEVLEAIDAGDEGVLREELGDLLLQVMMHSAIAQEREDGFDIGGVADKVRAKMIYRHPHVFADTTVSGAAEVVTNWERLKAAEKGERLSVLDGVTVTLPALAYALGLQKRPARLGFDEVATLAEASARVTSAVEQVTTVSAPSAAGAAADRAPLRGADWVVDEAPSAPSPVPPAPGGHGPPPPPASRAVEDAVGELLFAVVHLARKLRVNPEDALRDRADRFADRFRSVEGQARADGHDLHAMSATDWQTAWARESS